MSVVIEVENVVRTFKTERVIDNASFVLRLLRGFRSCRAERKRKDYPDVNYSRA